MTTPDQSTSLFVSEIQIIKDQVIFSAHIVDPPVAHEFTDYYNQLHLIMILVALTDRFEIVRASILHRTLFPTLDDPIFELICEETRMISRSPRVDIVMHFLTSKFKGNQLSSTSILQVSY